jgi:multidrug resistance efflux pump
MRYRWELEMKNNYMMLPLVLAGVIGGVYFFQMRVISDMVRPEPKMARAQIQAPEIAPPPRVLVAEAPAPAAKPPRAPAGIAAQGKVVAQTELEIKSKAGGFVKSVAVEVGDSVKPGQLLVELDPSEQLKQIRRAEASLAAAKSRLEQARENLSIAQMCILAQSSRAGACIKSATAKASRTRSRADRIKEALKKSAISQEEYDEAEASAVEAAANLELSKVQLEDVKTQEMTLELRRQDVACAEIQVTLDEMALQDAQQRLAETKIQTPIAGVVTTRAVQVGQFVAAGSASADTSLMKVADLSRLFVDARVPIGQAGQLKLGQSASIRVAGGDSALPGRIGFIAPCGTNTGTDVMVSVRIDLLQKPALKPETQVDIVIEPK